MNLLNNKRLKYGLVAALILTYCWRIAETIMNDGAPAIHEYLGLGFAVTLLVVLIAEKRPD